MFRSFRGASRIFLAVFGPLLVGGVAAFAHHNATLTRSFASATKPVAAFAPARTVVRETATNRPLVTLSLTGAVERDSKQVPVEKAGEVRPGEVVNFKVSSVNECPTPVRK